MRSPCQVEKKLCRPPKPHKQPVTDQWQAPIAMAYCLHECHAMITLLHKRERELLTRPPSSWPLCRLRSSDPTPLRFVNAIQVCPASLQLQREDRKRLY